MFNSKTNNSTPLFRMLSRKTLWRLVWLTVLLLHAPATFRVFSLAWFDESRWSSAFLIGATNLFFIIEIVFGWSFRVLTDRRRIVTFLVIIALLHVGALGPALSGMTGTEWTMCLVLTFASVAFAARLLPALMVMAKGWWNLLHQPVIQLGRNRYHLASAANQPALIRRFLSPSSSHRAPPFPA
ncbi:MAG: hypothetical protein KF841_14585 [Phycisphaerae bacterium]|nr:hypothetical protein [Phycisphaerae bacterium]